MSETPGQPGGWAAAGPTAGNLSYRTQNLKFEDIEVKLNEAVPWQSILKLLSLSWAVSAAVFFGFLVLWGIAALASVSNGSAPDGTLLTIGYVLSGIVFWVVLLMTQLTEPIAEWKTLLEDKYLAATSAYAAIYGALRRRHYPVLVTAMRIRSDVFSPEVVNNRLVITDGGSYVAYVSVFGYGTSLYVGWMMWRNRRGYVLIGHFIKDVVGSLLGRTSPIHQMLRTEKPRAMREAIHSAVREGVEVAVRGIEVTMVSTFGQDVPIQNLSAPAAMVPEPTVAAPYTPETSA